MSRGSPRGRDHRGLFLRTVSFLCSLLAVADGVCVRPFVISSGLKGGLRLDEDSGFGVLNRLMNEAGQTSASFLSGFPNYFDSFVFFFTVTTCAKLHDACRFGLISLSCTDCRCSVLPEIERQGVMIFGISPLVQKASTEGKGEKCVS